jgi:hypothetical protein
MTRDEAMDHEMAKRAIITVGTGRGFVVSDEREGSTWDRLVLTAAHCLPFFPPCASISYTEERTYKMLLGPVGDEPTVCAECLFVDPIGDLAVLGSPDNQVLPNEADMYEALTKAAVPLLMADAPKDGQAWLLSLYGRWFRCNTQHSGGPLWLLNAEENIAPGMSGSPIVADDGSAIGIVCVEVEGRRESGPNPRLAYNLPIWLCPNSILSDRRATA